jgi:hypothetical protein
VALEEVTDVHLWEGSRRSRRLDILASSLERGPEGYRVPVSEQDVQRFEDRRLPAVVRAHEEVHPPQAAHRELAEAAKLLD